MKVTQQELSSRCAFAGSLHAADSKSHVDARRREVAQYCVGLMSCGADCLLHVQSGAQELPDPVVMALGRSCGGPDAAVPQSVVLQGMQMASIALRVMSVCR